MKTRIFVQFLIAAAALACVSCENAKFLDQKPFSQTSPENFYKSESDMRMALISCYNVINGRDIPGASFITRGTYAQGLIYIMNAPSDDVVATTSSNDEGLEMEWANYIESTRCLRDFWKAYYAGINRCNTLLYYLDGVPMNDNTRTQYAAEARFLRAFFYYHLAWVFGGVPLVTAFDSDGQEPRASLEQVYRLIFSDLHYAYDNLNETGILSTSSANRYTAAAYIGRICNYLAACKRYNVGAQFVAEQPLNDFSFVDADAMTTEAKSALEDVALNSPYILIDKYDYLFRETTKSWQYQECLLLAEQPLSGSWGWWPGSFYLPSPTTNGATCPTVYGGRHVPTTRPFYYYHHSDVRRDHNLTGRISDGYREIQIDGFTYYDPAGPQQTLTESKKDENGDPVKGPDGNDIMETFVHPLYDSPTQTYLPVSGIQLCAGKFRLAKVEELQRTFQMHAVSYPLMRLADVYLMYAEALYFSGDETNGRVWMDKVLERAATDDENYQTLKAYYHRDDFLEELLESRERELIFEFSRKWDLIRFNRIDEAIASLNAEYVDEKLNDQAFLDELWEKHKKNVEYLKYTSGSYLVYGIPSLKQNWQSHKIWAPISEEQRGVNKHLKQNAGWGN